MEIDFFLSVASLSHVGHFIQYHRNTTPDNVDCVMSRSYGSYASVCAWRERGSAVWTDIVWIVWKQGH